MGLSGNSQRLAVQALLTEDFHVALPQIETSGHCSIYGVYMLHSDRAHPKQGRLILERLAAGSIGLHNTRSALVTS